MHKQFTYLVDFSVLLTIVIGGTRMTEYFAWRKSIDRITYNRVGKQSSET